MISAKADEIQNTSNTQETVCIAIEKEDLEPAKNADNNIFKNEDVQAIAAIAGGTGVARVAGTVYRE